MTFGFSPGGRAAKKRATTAAVVGGAAPTVSSVNKSGLTRIQGGILFRITGSGFTGASSAAFGGTNGTSLSVVNDTTIDVVTPAKAAGTYDVTVTTAGGTGTLTNGIKYVSPTSIFGANLKRHYSESYAAGVWTDESGTANTSQATAGKRPTASTFAGTADRPATHVALSFDGTDDGLNAGGDVELFTTAGTVAALFKTATIGADALIVGKLYASSAWALGGLTALGANLVGFASNAESDANAAKSDAAQNDDAVRRVIGTFLGHATNPTNKLYINGTLQSDTGAAGASITDTTDFVAIGCAMQDEATTAYHWTSLVAEVVIANVEADSTQRAELNAYLRDCAGQAS